MNEKDLALFKTIFQDSPNLAVLHLDNGMQFIYKIIDELVKKNEGTLNYQNFKDDGGCSRFKSKTRDYEYAILSDVLQHCPYKEKVLKLVYHSLENSSQIVIISNKKEIELNQIKELLDISNFLAINDIDLFEDYYIVVAKKMHMWDAGL
jgi:hypothetical protein